MALALRTSAVGGNTTSGTSPTAAITPAVNDLFLVFCQATGNANTAPTCSDGNTGGTYTLLWTALSNASGNTLSCFVRNNLLANTTATTVTVACGAHTAAEVSVVAISGGTVAGSAAIAQTATQANQAGSTTPAPAFTNNANYTNLILSAVGNATNPGGVAVTAGSTPTWTRDQNAGQTACGLCIEHATNGFNTKTVTWGGNSASVFSAGLVEVTIPPNTGVDSSKLVGYGVLAPSAGVDASKLVAYVIPAPVIGVDASKLVAYGVLTAINSNPPVWPSFSLANGNVGIAYSQNWDLTPAAVPTSFSLQSGTLPTGLSLASVGGTDQGSLTGTPTVAAVYTFTLRATNTYGFSDKSFTVTISTPAGGAGGSFTYAG